MFNVPRYEPEENGENGDGHVSPFTLIFWMILASRIWWKSPGLDMSSFFNAANIRIGIEALAIAIGWTAFMMLMYHHFLPAFFDWWYGTLKAAATEEKPRQPPTADALPPKPASAPAPRVNLPANGGRAEQVTAVIWTNDHLITVGDETIDLHDYQVSREQWEMLVKARRRGQFANISLTALHDGLGIDRKNRASLQDSDAHRVIGLLEDLGLVESGGEQRPYEWTRLGESILPLPPRRTGDGMESAVVQPSGDRWQRS